MTRRAPLVSVGLPVYNGERYLAQALDAMLAQDLEDFELIVSDNASEDATGEIVREYAASDPRVRYFRNDRNVGLTRNFNRVFELSSGKYFKWTAHDDWHPEQTLRVCTEVLEGDPSAVLCATAVAIIDEDGTVFEEWHPSADLRAPEPHTRLHRLLWSLGETHHLFSVMRADALRRTPLYRNFLGADRVLLAQLALMGPMWQLPEVMHHYRAPRLRPASLGPPPPGGPRISVILDPANRDRLPLRTWRLIHEHLALVGRARLAPRHKLWLSLDVLARFGVRDGRRAAAELYHSGRILAARAARWRRGPGNPEGVPR
jgi:glycosyltransferase involved in cell wall biosynthesis